MDDVDPELSRFNICFKELLNVDSLLRWELSILDENRHEDDIHRADGFFITISELLKIHQEYAKKNFTAALQIIDDLETTIENSIVGFNFIRTISRAVDHLIKVSKAIIFLQCGKIKECFETLKASTSHRDFNNKEKAAILAIRSACCALYSYEGIKHALDFIDRAVHQDPLTPYWRFLEVVYLYKLRTALNPTDPPSLQELKLLNEITRDEQNNPLFMVYLADVYRELANANKNRKELNFWFIPEELRNSPKVEVDKMYKESKTLYEESFKLGEKCHFVAFRCANGLMKLPQQYQVIKTAKEIVTNLIEGAGDSGYGNTVAAFYYSQFAKKPELAKKYLDQAKTLNVFNAHINSIKLIYKEDRGKFDIDVLKKTLETFREAPKKKIVYAQLISYYIFIKQDTKTACENMRAYLEIGGPRNSLERHVSCFLDVTEPFSLIDVVADQVKFTGNLQNQKAELLKFFDEFVHFTHFYNLNCNWKSRPQNLRKQILDKRVPDLKSRVLQEPRPNTNPRNATNRGPNQNNRAPNQTQHQKPGFNKAYPKNSQPPQNGPGPSKPNNQLPHVAPNQAAASYQTGEPALQSNAPPGKRQTADQKSNGPSNLQTKTVHDGRHRRDVEESRGRRHRRSSASSSYSDHDRHSRDRKRHRRRKHSSSERDSRGRRHRSSSRSRRHRLRSTERSHAGKKHRHRRYSSTSSESSSFSYDRYEKKGRKHNRYRSSTSDASSSEYYEKKESSRHTRKRSPKRSREDQSDLSRRMNEMSLNKRDQYSRDK